MNTPIFVVVSEEWYGGEDDIQVFASRESAEMYVELCAEKYSFKVDFIILERVLKP